MRKNVLILSKHRHKHAQTTVFLIYTSQQSTLPGDIRTSTLYEHIITSLNRNESDFENEDENI